MKKTTTYCDICGELAEENDTYAIDIRWWSDNGYHRYDICGDCKREADNKTGIDHPLEKRNRTFLGLIRKIIKKTMA
jgi:hypothetical protein